MLTPLFVMKRHWPSPFQERLPWVVDGMIPGSEREERTVGAGMMVMLAGVRESFFGQLSDTEAEVDLLQRSEVFCGFRIEV